MTRARKKNIRKKLGVKTRRKNNIKKGGMLPKLVRGVAPKLVRGVASSVVRGVAPSVVRGVAPSVAPNMDLTNMDLTNMDLTNMDLTNMDLTNMDLTSAPNVFNNFSTFPTNTNYDFKLIREQMAEQKKQIEELTNKFKEIKLEEPKNNHGKTFSDYVKESWENTFSREGIKKTAAHNLKFIPILIILYIVCKTNNKKDCDKNIIKYILRQLNYLAPTITNTVSDEDEIINYLENQSNRIIAIKEDEKTKITYTSVNGTIDAYVSEEDLQKIKDILESKNEM
jgi:hypothetical protein